MAGILDAKTRIIDAFITDAGKKQISTGKLQIQFASFTDRGTFYEGDPISGSSDASTRIYFEAGSTIADHVTLETDDSGHLVNYTGGDLQLIDGFLVDPTGSFVTGSLSPGFASLAGELLVSSSKNYAKLQLIGTDHPFAGDKFTLSTNNVPFHILEDSPIDPTRFVSDADEFDTETLTPIFLDRRFGHLLPYKFLPPILPVSASAIVSDTTTAESIDTSPWWASAEKVTTFLNLNEPEIIKYEGSEDGSLVGTGYRNGAGLLERPMQEVIFEQTSISNNIAMQIFEMGPSLKSADTDPTLDESVLSKLDVVDFGEFVSVDGVNRRVFFAGRVVADPIGIPSFLNVFTIIMDNEKD